MKQIKGIWFPDSDMHFQHFLNEDGSYQRDIFNAAMEYVTAPKIFYDIGAHVGLWSLMAHKMGFREIHAYEPNPATFNCLRANTKHLYINIFNRGVSRISTQMEIVVEDPNNSGAIKLELRNGDNEIEVSPIAYKGLANMRPHEALIKIDTEGMEANCIEGLREVIYALRPVICVEQRSNKDALKLLCDMGMQIVKIIRKDYILTWKNQ